MWKCVCVCVCVCVKRHGYRILGGGNFLNADGVLREDAGKRDRKKKKKKKKRKLDRLLQECDFEALVCVFRLY